MASILRTNSTRSSPRSPFSTQHPSTLRNQKRAFTSACLPALDPGLSAQGQQCQSVASSFSSTYRQLFSLPFLNWQNSSDYPGSPLSPVFQLLGATSVARSAYGVADLTSAIRGAKQAYATGDTKGFYYSMAEGIVGGMKLAYGPVIGTSRVATIQNFLQAQGSLLADQWKKAAKIWRVDARILQALTYAANALREGCKAKNSSDFQKKVRKRRSEAEKLRFLQERLRADESTLIAKEKKRLFKQNPQLHLSLKETDKIAREHIEAQGKALALEQQTSAVKEQIAHMDKLGVCKKGFRLRQEEVEQVVKEHLGEKGLVAYGKQLLIDNLGKKKMQKMTRLIGSAAIKEVIQAKSPNPSILKKIDQLSLIIKGKYRQKALVYATGAVLVTLATLYTGGLASMIFAMGLAYVYATELYWHVERMQELYKGQSSPPGKWDKAVPFASLLLNASIGITMVILATMYPFSLFALIVTGVALIAWAGLNGLQIHYIDKRKEKYIDKLLQKPHLELCEFSYILNSASREKIKISLQAAFAKLSEKDQNGLNKSVKIDKQYRSFFMRREEPLEVKRERLKRACQKWTLQLQKLHLKELALHLEKKFGKERVSPEKMPGSSRVFYLS